MFVISLLTNEARNEQNGLVINTGCSGTACRCGCSRGAAAEEVPRIGYVSSGDAARESSRAEAIRLALRELGAEMLESGVVITVGDVQSFLEQHQLALSRGDVVLIHTGWSRLWQQRDVRYCMSEPGPGRETAVWLADQEIVALGTDTMAVDVDPPEDPAYPRVVHQIMLVDRGINLIENMYLDELVRDKVYEFLFILAAPKLKGGTAFPVEPIAII